MIARELSLKLALRFDPFYSVELQVVLSKTKSFPGFLTLYYFLHVKIHFLHVKGLPRGKQLKMSFVCTFYSSPPSCGLRYLMKRFWRKINHQVKSSWTPLFSLGNLPYFVTSIDPVPDPFSWSWIAGMWNPHGIPYNSLRLPEVNPEQRTRSNPCTLSCVFPQKVKEEI